MGVARKATKKRVVILMTASAKSELVEKARRQGISAVELVRRAVAAYDPVEMEQLTVMARAFREHAERALAAIDRTNASMELTLDQLSAHAR